MSLSSTIHDKHVWVIRLRYLISAVLAGSFIIRVPLESVLDMSLSFPMLVLAAIVTVIVATNVLWSVLLKRKDISADVLGYYQCIFDLIVISLLVHQFGASGPSGYLFVLVIFVAGLLLPRKGIVLIAAASSVLYLLLLLMERYGYSVPLDMKLIDFSDIQLVGDQELQAVGLLPANIQFLIDVVIKVFFFYLVAYSSANMQELLTKAQRESEFLAAFNQGIVDMVPMGIMVFDAGRNIVLFNPAMERTSFVKSEDAIGRPLHDVFPGLDESWGAAIEKTESTGEEIRLLGATMALPGDRSIRANVRFQPLKVQEQILGTVCCIQTAAR